MMSTAQKCCDLLSSVTTRPVILIVDGIDQVSVLIVSLVKFFNTSLGSGL